MRPPKEIPEITQTIELGFLEFLSRLSGEFGYTVVRDPHCHRDGSSVTLKNRVGVEFILEVEATWEPE